MTPEQKERVCLNVGAQPSVAGKGLSSNDYTDAEKLKLSGITEGAVPNVIEEITVNGSAVTPVNKSVALTIPEAVTVDQTYNGSSTNPQSGIAVAQALSGTGQVPTVTSNDDGKVLKASYDSTTSQGSFRWDSAPSGVPSTTSSDEGKVLGVTNSTGTLGWVSQTPAAHDSTVTVKTGDSTPVTLGSFTTDQASNSDITIPLAVPTGTGEKSGLMSAADKAKLDGLGNVVVTGTGSINVTPTTSAGTTTYTVSEDFSNLYVDDTLSKTANTPNAGDITLGVNTKSSNSYLDKTNGLGVDLTALKTGIGTGNNGLVPSAGTSGQFLKHDGSWGTPPDTTYSTFSTSDNGLVPKPTSQEVSDGKYLKSDGTWGVPTNTTYSTFNTTTDGLVPKANGTGDTGKFLKGDGSWATPTDTTYGVFSTSADGLVPASDGTGETGKFLKGDGTWATPTDTTYSTFDTTTDGLVPKANGTGDTGKFLKGDGSWATPTDTTYSGGNGIDITGTVLSVDIATSGSGLEFSSGKLKVNGNASQAIEVGSSGVGIKLATDSGLEFSSGLKIKTDGTTIHTNASGALEVIGGGGGTTYTSGDGIDISAQDVISVKTDGTTIHANASGQLEVIGGGGGTTYTAGDGIDITSGTISANIDTDAGLTFDSSNPKKIQVNAGTNIGFNSSTGALDVPTVSASTGGTGGTNGVMLATDKEKLDSATVAVQLEGALAPLTPSSGVATIPNAVATGETGATNGLMTADDKKSLGTAVQYKVNPLESGTPVLLAQQMYVVESDAQIISIAAQSGEIQGKGTIFFRVGV